MEVKSRPRLDDLFPGMKSDRQDGDVEEPPLSPVRKQIERFESKSKKRQAPLPPGKQMNLPKIGNYQPKSLISAENVPNSPPKDSSKLSDGFRFEPIQFVIRDKDDSPPQPKSEKPNNFILMGDNNKLMTIHSSDNDGKGRDGEDSGIASPDKPVFTENPLFEKDEPETPLLEDYKDKNSELNNFDNPGFEDTPRSEDAPHSDTIPQFDDAPPVDYPLEEEDEERPKPPPRRKKMKSPDSSRKTSDNDENYPYIPVPDYYEGSTRLYNGGPTDAPRHEPIFEEFGGEDYSKYLSEEEDYEFDTYPTWRNDMKYNKKKKNLAARPQSSAPRPRMPTDPPKRTAVRPIVGKSRQLESGHESIRRNTIRDFTFSDSKIGYDGSTVRSTVSTTAKGRYIKRSKERAQINDAGGASYEDFLRNRHNENGSDSSNDSGLEIREDIDYQNRLFIHSQPKLKDGKSSLWKKLTWKFRRNTAGYQMS